MEELAQDKDQGNDKGQRKNDTSTSMGKGTRLGTSTSTSTSAGIYLPRTETNHAKACGDGIEDSAGRSSTFSVHELAR